MATQSSVTREYLRTKVLTASAEQLQLLLYDGAIRFTRQGREALAAGNFETSCDRLLRAQQILLELRAALRFDIDRGLCQRINAVYSYIFRRLVDANTRHSLEAADQAIELLNYQRQTWAMLIDKLVGPAKSADPAATPPQPLDVAI